MISAGQTPPQSNPPPAGQGTGLAPNIASLLCYICSPITGIIFLLIEKEDKDVKFMAVGGDGGHLVGSGGADVDSCGGV